MAVTSSDERVLPERIFGVPTVCVIRCKVCESQIRAAVIFVELDINRRGPHTHTQTHTEVPPAWLVISKSIILRRALRIESYEE